MNKLERLERDVEAMLDTLDQLVDNHPPAAIVNMLTRTKRDEQTEQLIDKWIDLAAAVCNARSRRTLIAETKGKR